jgi:hypothetical protein
MKHSYRTGLPPALRQIPANWSAPLDILLPERRGASLAADTQIKRAVDSDDGAFGKKRSRDDGEVHGETQQTLPALDREENTSSSVANGAIGHILRLQYFHHTPRHVPGFYVICTPTTYYLCSVECHGNA